MASSSTVPVSLSRWAQSDVRYIDSIYRGQHDAPVNGTQTAGSPPGRGRDARVTLVR